MSTSPSSFDTITHREAGLKKKLTAPQLTMIALGGAIGTGLFLGSKFAIGFAGPSVIVSYIIGGFISLLLMVGLSEMTVKHSTSGSFGAYAEYYLSPMMGFVMRYMYWSCLVLAIGAEVTAVGEYMKYWLPNVPSWIWTFSFSSLLIGVNALNVKAFGTMEYWFSAIKVFAIIGFIIAGVAVLIGNKVETATFSNFSAGDGFWAGGFSGMWFAVIVSIFSYLSIEMIALAAGEAEDPRVAVKKAFKSTIFRLVFFYLVTLTLIIALTPTSSIINSDTSPFVTVFDAIGLGFGSHLINFVVIVASLSAMNSQLYSSTRMMFSLSRSGDAPKIFGKLHSNGTPITALALCCIGVIVAIIIKQLLGSAAITTMLSISMFGAMINWLMIFLTHFAFRRWHEKRNEKLEYRIPMPSWLSLVGAVLMFFILATTPFAPGFKATLIYGIPALLISIIGYYMVRHWKQKDIIKMNEE